MKPGSTALIAHDRMIGPSSIGRQFSETDDIVMKAVELVDRLNRRS